MCHLYDFYLTDIFLNHPSSTKNEISSWKFGNKYRKYKKDIKVRLYGNNFFELKKEKISNKNFFWNFKKLVPYKRTYVSFV